MPHSRHSTFAVILLALFLVAGSFSAGYLLLRRENPGITPFPVAVPAASSPVATAPAPPATGPHLVIKKALYGDLPEGVSIDVTPKVIALLANDALTVAASNDLFGDPTPGIVKKLRIDYTLDGVAHSRVAEENSSIALSAGHLRLIIKKATYGDLPGGAVVDVTDKVVLAAGDTLTIAASNDNFGDPAPGIVKKLRVDYTFDLKEKTKTVDENESLQISSTGE